MDNELTTNVVLNVDECGFMLDFCDGEIGLDLAIKLSMARVSDQSTLTVPLLGTELWRLIRTLTQRARYATNKATKEWAEELAMRLKLVAESEKVF